MSDSRFPLRALPAPSRLAIPGLLLLGLGACAQSDDDWRRQMEYSRAELFERGLAAIALARQSQTGLGGVPTRLIEVLDHSHALLGPPARDALLELGPAALPEMAICLCHNVFYGDLSLPTLQAALERHGAASVEPIVDAMPPTAEPGSERAAKVVATIGEAAVAPLVRILAAGPRARTERAAFLLGRLGPRAAGAAEALVAAAANADPEVASVALRNLYCVNPLGWKVEPALRTALQSPDPRLRDAATDALARVLLERGGRTTPDSRAKKRLDLLRDASRLGEAADAAYVQALLPVGSTRGRFAADVLLLRAASWSVAARVDAGDAPTLQEAEQRLLGGSPGERRLAALEIGRRGRGALPALPSVLAAAGDADEGLRFCASLALALVAIDVGRAAALAGELGND